MEAINEIGYADWSVRKCDNRIIILGVGLVPGMVVEPLVCLIPSFNLLFYQEI
jgi:hypothetical protein